MMAGKLDRCREVGRVEGVIGAGIDDQLDRNALALLPQLPSVELVYSQGRRSNSRVVSELANYLADSLSNAGTLRGAPIMA